MSLLLANLLPGLVLLALGVPLLIGSKTAAASLKAFPRSTVAAAILFGGATLWFLYYVWHLSAADFGEYRTILFIFFAAIAVLSFKYASDFLAVRGACALVLLAAAPLLAAGFMNFDHPQIVIYKIVLFIGIVLALWLAVQPYRVRDFFEWLFRVPNRSRVLGGVLGGVGLLLSLLAFTF